VIILERHGTSAAPIGRALLERDALASLQHVAESVREIPVGLHRHEPSSRHGTRDHVRESVYRPVSQPVGRMKIRRAAEQRRAGAVHVSGPRRIARATARAGVSRHTPAGREREVLFQ